MIELKFIKKINQKLKDIASRDTNNVEIQDLDQSEQIVEKKVIAEYKETLHSEGYRSSKHSTDQTKTSFSANQRLWRDVGTIESDVDKLDKKTVKSKKKENELDKKVDKIIINKKEKN